LVKSFLVCLKIKLWSTLVIMNTNKINLMFDLPQGLQIWWGAFHVNGLWWTSMLIDRFCFLFVQYNTGLICSHWWWFDFGWFSSTLVSENQTPEWGWCFKFVSFSQILWGLGHLRSVLDKTV
jgi:hypothetical protein